jgi:tRNA(fMet)-specific endonuclease VapC
MRGKNSTLKQKLESTATKDITVCSIVKAELFYGAMKRLINKLPFSLCASA